MILGDFAPFGRDSGVVTTKSIQIRGKHSNPPLKGATRSKIIQSHPKPMETLESALEGGDTLLCCAFVCDRVLAIALRLNCTPRPRLLFQPRLRFDR